MVGLALAAMLLAAIVGGVVGGLIVRETWSPGSTAAPGEATAAVCAAANVADRALPSVVTVRAGSGSGSGVVIRSGGYILTNNHVSPSSGPSRPRICRRSNWGSRMRSRSASRSWLSARRSG